MHILRQITNTICGRPPSPEATLDSNREAMEVEETCKPASIDIVDCMYCGTPHIWVRGTVAAGDGGPWVCLLCGRLNPQTSSVETPTSSPASDQDSDPAMQTLHANIED
jgi:hypothetical protein